MASNPAGLTMLVYSLSPHVTGPHPAGIFSLPSCDWSNHAEPFATSAAGYILRKVGPRRARTMEPGAEGGDRGYSVSGLLGKK
eukprot:85431-Pyramimonas_sp.AAC.1